MLQRVGIVATALCALALLAGCSGNSNLSQSSSGEIPEWYNSVPQDPNYLFAANSQVSMDMQLSVDKAVAAGRDEIGRQLEIKLKAMQKRFVEEVGQGENTTLLSQFTQASTNVISTTLNGSSVKYQQTRQDGSTWRAYVLVQYPLGSANEALLQQIKKSNELYTRFRSSQAYDELEKQVEQYEAEKNKQK